MWLHVACYTCTLLQLRHFSIWPLHRGRHCLISSLLLFGLIVHMVLVFLFYFLVASALFTSLCVFVVVHSINLNVITMGKPKFSTPDLCSHKTETSEHAQFFLIIIVVSIQLHWFIHFVFKSINLSFLYDLYYLFTVNFCSFFSLDTDLLFWLRIKNKYTFRIYHCNSENVMNKWK